MDEDKDDSRRLRQGRRCIDAMTTMTPPTANAMEVVEMVATVMMATTTTTMTMAEAIMTTTLSEEKHKSTSTRCTGAQVHKRYKTTTILQLCGTTLPEPERQLRTASFDRMSLDRRTIPAEKIRF